MPDLKFQLGEQVTWITKGNGTEIQRTGIVVLIIPRGILPMPTVRSFCKRNGLRTPELGGSRQHESYIIAVPGETIRHKPRIFWPRLTELRLGLPDHKDAEIERKPSEQEPLQSV